MNMSPSVTASYVGPKTSTPLIRAEEKLEDSSEDELDVDTLDDSTAAHLLPLFRQIRDEYASIEENTSAILEETGLAFDQLSDDAKAAVCCLVEHEKALAGGSTSASAVIHAFQQLDSFSKNRHWRKMKEDASKLTQMLVEETHNLEMTKQKLNDVMKIVEDEKLSLEKMQLETKPPSAIQKKKKTAEKLEAKIDRLHMEEATPQACMAELERRTELEREVKAMRAKLKDFCDLPPDIAGAEKVLHNAKLKLASLKAQLKALYKP